MSVMEIFHQSSFSLIMITELGCPVPKNAFHSSRLRDKCLPCLEGLNFGILQIR